MDPNLNGSVYVLTTVSTPVSLHPGGGEIAPPAGAATPPLPRLMAWLGLVQAQVYWMSSLLSAAGHLEGAAVQGRLQDTRSQFSVAMPSVISFNSMLKLTELH